MEEEPYTWKCWFSERITEGYDMFTQSLEKESQDTQLGVSIGSFLNWLARAVKSQQHAQAT